MPTTIDAVLEALDLIIAKAIIENDPNGYFAYVYRRTTEAVRQALLAKRFQDNERMERFDVAFANLYLTAHQHYHSDQVCATSWQLAFDTTKERKAILQHVMLGMNAHINLDLGIAAGQIMQGSELEALAHDFRLVNEILFEIVEELQERVSRISSLFKVFDRLGRQKDEVLLDFSMRAAREQAWLVAGKVWAAGDQGETVNLRIDKNVHLFGQRLARPRSRFSRWLWKAIAFTESQRVGKNLERLRF